MSDLDTVASRENAALVQRVEALKQEAQRATALQQDIAETHEVCFDMCVPNSSNAGLTKPERRCVKQCAARFYESQQRMMEHYFLNMVAQQQQQQQGQKRKS